MKKIVCILISTCCLVCNSFAQCLKFNYEGARMYLYEKKDYDPSSGIIKIDLDNKNIKIYTGLYNVLFSASPIYFESVHKSSLLYGESGKKDKCLHFANTYTCRGEECGFFINLDKKKAHFNQGKNFLIEFENLKFYHVIE